LFSRVFFHVAVTLISVQGISFHAYMRRLGLASTLVVLPEVAIAASQVDTNVDALGIINPPTTSPVNRFNTESYFLHGIDLGVTYNF